MKDWLEKIHCNTALANTDTIRGTSRERIYNELGLKSLADRRWHRKMTFFYKIVKNLAPKYLQSYLLPEAMNQYFPTRVTITWQHVLPYCIYEWDKLNDNLRNANYLYQFKN